MRAALAVMAWIGAVLVADAVPLAAGLEPWRQGVLGVATWVVLLAFLRGRTPLVRAQTAVVVVLATCVEYTFSPLLQAYVYRIGTVPFFVPPGHGLVYLAAASIAGSPVLTRGRGGVRAAAVAATVVASSAWALYGLVLAERRDVLGAFWWLCLLGFLAWGRSRLLYVGAFVVVSYLELTGTLLGTWAWAVHDPVLGVVGQGNPPSGAAGGYGWFDLYALILAPRILALGARLRALLGSGRQRGEDLVVQQAVGGDGIAAEAAVDAVQ